jgi:hypothetical protein
MSQDELRTKASETRPWENSWTWIPLKKSGRDW